MVGDRLCDDIEEPFDTRAAEGEPEVFTELVGLVLPSDSFLPEAGWIGREDCEACDDSDEVLEDDEACSRAALRFCFPRSTPLLATVV